jgi:gluconolactonase
MMYLNRPPVVVKTKVFTSLPQNFRKQNISTPWAAANKDGHALDSFLEGPSFDAHGNLYVVDIPFGRIFRVSPAAEWSLVAEYDGLPNGLKFHPDGNIFVADYKRGLMQLDPETGSVTPVLSSRNGESFKGINDLAIASNGDIFFTDQGQTGLHDPSGRVFRLSPQGKLDCLLSNGISPNGLVLDSTERTLFVAMTRDNAIWRIPLRSDGSVAKVGRFCSMFGTGGPDGLAMDEAGNLLVAHSSLGEVFVFGPSGELVTRVQSCAGKTTTNLAFGGSDRRHLFITESSTASILVCKLPNSGITLPRRQEHQ